MSAYWPYVISGLADGSIYGLAAVGLVLTFRISGVFNFAHGSVAAVSAYVFFELYVRNGVPWPLAAVATLIVIGVGGGLVLERIAFWLQEAPTVQRVVATVGLLTLLASLLMAIFGATPLPLQPYLPRGGVEIGGVLVSGGDIIVFTIGAVGTGLLYVFLRRFRLGLAMQAAVDDDRLLSLQGTNPRVVRALAWTIGSCFVSISGMLLAPKLGVDVNVLTFLILTAFGAAAVGAFSSLPLCYVGALAIGVATNVLSHALAGARSFTLQTAYLNVPFVVLFVAMIVIPRRRLVERGVRLVKRPPRLPTFPPAVSATASSVALAIAVAMPFVDRHNTSTFTAGLAYVIMFASLALLVWTAGQVSLAHMSFAAIGASTFSRALGAGIPWLVALFLAGAAALVVGVIVAIPAIRISGIYLAIFTFGFGLLLERMVFNTVLMFGSLTPRNVPRPDLLGSIFNTRSDRGYYFVVLAICVASLLALSALRRARFGRLLRAFGDSPVALEAHGASTLVTGVLVFGISAFFAAVSGAVLAGVAGSASAITYNFSLSLALVAVLVASSVFTFGLRLPTAVPIVAAILYQVVKVYVDSPTFSDIQGVAFGILALGVACAPGIRSSLGLERAAAGRLAARDGSARRRRLHEDRVPPRLLEGYP